jgi:hypothetical protein
MRNPVSGDDPDNVAQVFGMSFNGSLFRPGRVVRPEQTFTATGFFRTATSTSGYRGCIFAKGFPFPGAAGCTASFRRILLTTNQKKDKVVCHSSLERRSLSPVDSFTMPTVVWLGSLAR